MDLKSNESFKFRNQPKNLKSHRKLEARWIELLASWDTNKELHSREIKKLARAGI